MGCLLEGRNNEGDNRIIRKLLAKIDHRKDVYYLYEYNIVSHSCIIK